jgi:hypothetical protein
MTSLGRCWVVLCFVLSCAGVAHAQSPKNVCLAAFEDGQRQQLQGKFELAAEQFARCAESSCPASVRAECGSFLATARSPVPGLLFAPVDSATDRPLDGVILSVDGRDGRPFDGRMVRVEPGEHQVVFQRPGYTSISLHLVSQRGDLPRLIPLRFKPLQVQAAAQPGPRSKLGPAVSPGEDLPRPAPLRPESFSQLAAAAEDASWSKRSVLPQAAPEGRGHEAYESGHAAPRSGKLRGAAVLAAGLVGGVGAVSFVYFGLSARSADRDLDGCTPNCDPSTVTTIKREYLLANVSLGVGLAGAIGASVLWFILPGSEPAARVAGGRAPRWMIGVGPVTTVTTRF